MLLTSPVLLGMLGTELSSASVSHLMFMLADGSHGDSGMTAEEPAVTKTLRFGQRAGRGIRSGTERQRGWGNGNRNRWRNTEEMGRRGKVGAGDLSKRI